MAVNVGCYRVVIVVAMSSRSVGHCYSRIVIARSAKENALIDPQHIYRRQNNHNGSHRANRAINSERALEHQKLTDEPAYTRQAERTHCV